MLLQRLLSRGDRVEILQGRLHIESASGNAVPSVWLEKHRQELELEIVKQLRLFALRYDSYSTGHYGRQRYGGVTIQLCSVATLQSHYAIFNADLTRARNSKSGKAGTLLPKGHFRVGRKSQFARFWLSTSLKAPKRLSVFHDYMGNLRQVLLTADTSVGERLDASSLKPLEIDYQAIVEVLGLKASPLSDHTSVELAPYTNQTSLPDKRSPQSQMLRELQPSCTAGESNCGTRLKGTTDIRERPLPTNNTGSSKVINLKNQSIDEWLNAYGE